MQTVLFWFMLSLVSLSGSGICKGLQEWMEKLSSECQPQKLDYIRSSSATHSSFLCWSCKSQLGELFCSLVVEAQKSQNCSVFFQANSDIHTLFLQRRPENGWQIPRWWLGKWRSLSYPRKNKKQFDLVLVCRQGRTSESIWESSWIL